MKDYRELICEVLRAVEINSPTSYAWFGVPSVVVSAEAQGAITRQDARMYLRYALKNRLYADFYCPGVVRAPADYHSAQIRTISPFLRAISDANAGSGSSSHGWRFLRNDGDALVLEKHGLHVWVNPTEVVANALTGDDGDYHIAVTMPKELFRLSPGFYMALGDRDLSDDVPEAQVRFYWNLDAQAAAPLMNLVTTSLNQRHIPFRLKVVDSETGYSRTDAGVLYVYRDDQEVVVELVEEIYEQLTPCPKWRTPAFALALAPGLGFAENPLDLTESFGTARCDLLAEGILRAHERRAGNVSERLGVVESCFKEASITLDAPYLNPMSTDKPPAPFR
jgi:hypothetical protein